MDPLLIGFGPALTRSASLFNMTPLRREDQVANKKATPSRRTTRPKPLCD